MEEMDREGVHSSKEKGKKGQEGAKKHGGCSPKKRCKELWHNTRMKLWGIVESKYFNRGIMIAILINTISMGIEHHEQVQTATAHQFCFEMLLVTILLFLLFHRFFLFAASSVSFSVHLSLLHSCLSIIK